MRQGDRVMWLRGGRVAGWLRWWVYEVMETRKKVNCNRSLMYLQSRFNSSFVFAFDFEYCQHMSNPAVGELKVEKRFSQVISEGGMMLQSLEDG